MQLRLSCEKLPLNDSNIFHKDLLEALVSSNIPIHKITKEGFKAFLEKYTGRSINSDTFYRSTIIDQVYSKKFENVKSKFLNNEEFYLIFDESTDFKSRHILSLLIGCCSKLCRVDPYLLGIIKLDNVNSQAISSEILAKLTEFFDRNFNAV